MKTAIIALSLVLLILVACAPQKVRPSVPIAQPPVSQPVTQPAAPVTSGVAEVDGFDQDLSELDKLDADLKELDTI
jgi:hypothetical protein